MAADTEITRIDHAGGFEGRPPPCLDGGQGRETWRVRKEGRCLANETPPSKPTSHRVPGVHYTSCFPASAPGVPLRRPTTTCLPRRAARGEPRSSCTEPCWGGRVLLLRTALGQHGSASSFYPVTRSTARLRVVCTGSDAVRIRTTTNRSHSGSGCAAIHPHGRKRMGGGAGRGPPGGARRFRRPHRPAPEQVGAACAAEPVPRR